MSDNKPSFIKMTGGGRIENLTVAGNKVIGDVDFINNEEVDINEATIEDNLLVSNQQKIEKKWHETTVAYILITIICGLVVAFCSYSFGWTK